MRDPDGHLLRSLSVTVTLGLWFVAMVFLWLPGFGNVAVPHADYTRDGYGLLCYYAVESSKGVVIRSGVRPLNLLVTILLSILATAFAAYDVKRHISS